MLDAHHKNQKGVAIYLALAVMTILLAMALGLSAILLRQMRITKGMGDSVFSFFAADTGMERELYTNNATGTVITGTLNGATYRTEVITPGSHPYCPTTGINNCVLSTGTYQQKTKREILMPR